MTNEDIFRTRLESALRQLDWREGIAKAALIEHLAADPPAQQAMRHALVDGVYFSPADVLNSLPPGAWEASGAPPPVPTASPAPSIPTAPAAPSAPAAHPASLAGPAGADLPAPFNQVPPPVLAGAAGTVAVIGFVAALVWLLRRLRES